MCQHRLQYRAPAYVERRDQARTVIRALAMFATDPFTARRAGEIAHQAISPRKYDFTYMRVLEWLRQHHFMRMVERRGGWTTYELTEQALRWLDWSGFDWSQRKAV